MKIKLSPEATDEVVGKILYRAYQNICKDLEEQYYKGFSGSSSEYDVLLRYKKALDVTLEYYVFGWEAEK